MFRKANEAMALLDEARALGPAPPGSWGMAGASVVEYLRGYALMMRGDYAEAKRLLVAVVAREPNLSEAALALAIVEAKLGEEPRKALLLGVWRHRAPLMVVDSAGDRDGENVPARDPMNEGEVVQPVPSRVFDLSRGQPGKLPDVEIPKDVQALNASVSPFTEAMLAAQGAAAQLGNTVVGPSLSAFKASPAPAAYKARLQGLYSLAVLRVHALPELDAAAAETDRLGERLEKLTEDLADRFVEQVPPINERYSQITPMTDAVLKAHFREVNALTQKALEAWQPLAMRYFTAIEREYLIRSAFMSGMMAQIGDPRRSCRPSLRSRARSGSTLRARSPYLPARRSPRGSTDFLRRSPPRKGSSSPSARRGCATWAARLKSSAPWPWRPASTPTTRRASSSSR